MTDPGSSATPATIPLSQRRGDIIFAVICGSFIFTTFVPDITSVLQIDLVDLEATRQDPPLWPPMFILEALAAYGHACDHLMLYNPPIFQSLMWGDVFFTGPYYIAALVAFIKGYNWIRIPTFLYGAHVLSYMPVLLVGHLQGIGGQYASPNPTLVFAFYSPYWIFALALMIRMRRHEPFTDRATMG